MRAGLLKEPIEIYEPITSSDDYGTQKTIYVFKLKTKARLTHNSGGRATENNEIVFNYSKTFTVRRYINVTELDRIKWNDKYYRILDIEPNKQNQEIKINCELIND